MKSAKRKSNALFTKERFQHFRKLFSALLCYSSPNLHDSSSWEKSTNSYKYNLNVHTLKVPKSHPLLSLLSIASPYTVWMIKFFIETIQSHAMTHVPQFEPAPHQLLTVNIWASLLSIYFLCILYSVWMIEMCVFNLLHVYHTLLLSPLNMKTSTGHLNRT